MAERVTARMSEDDKEVGRRVWERRRFLGFSRRVVGEALGVSGQQVHKWECGINRISAGRLKEIAQLFDTPIEWFFRPAPTGIRKAA